MPAEAIALLGLKATLELILFGIDLALVPKRVRRCLELVRVCDTDLQHLIDLRNEHLERLESRPRELQRANLIIENATQGIAKVCRLVEKCRPEAHNNQTGLFARLWWKTIDSPEFDTQRPIIEQQHSAVLHELSFLRQLALMAPLVDSAANAEGGEAPEVDKRGKTIEFENLHLLADVLGGDGNALAAASSTPAGAPSSQANNSSPPDTITATHPSPTLEARTFTPPPPYQEHRSMSTTVPVATAFMPSMTPNLSRGGFSSLGFTSARTAKEKEIEEGLAILFSDFSVGPSQQPGPTWQPPALQDAHLNANVTAPAVGYTQVAAEPPAAPLYSTPPASQWQTAQHSMVPPVNPPPTQPMGSAHPQGISLSQTQMQRFSLMSNASTPSLISNRDSLVSLPSPPLPGSMPQNHGARPVSMLSAYQQPLRPMASQSSLLLSSNYPSHRASLPASNLGQPPSNMASPLIQGSGPQAAQLPYSGGLMAANAPVNQFYGSSNTTASSSHSQLFGGGNPSAGGFGGQGLLSSHSPQPPAPPTTSRSFSPQYDFSLWEDPSPGVTSRPVGLGVTPQTTQQQHFQPPPSLPTYGQGGVLPSTAPTTQNMMGQNLGLYGGTHATAIVPVQPLSTIPPEMIYPQSSAVTSSYLPSSQGNATSQHSATMPVPAPPANNYTTIPSTPPGQQSSTFPAGLNYGIVGQLTAASNYTPPSQARPPSLPHGTTPFALENPTAAPNTSPTPSSSSPSHVALNYGIVGQLSAASSYAPNSQEKAQLSQPMATAPPPFHNAAAVPYTPPSPPGSNPPVALNYGLVGQLAAASAAKRPGSGVPASLPASPFSTFGTPSTVASSLLATPPPATYARPSVVELPGVSMTRYESMAVSELDAGVAGGAGTDGGLPAELAAPGGEKKPAGMNRARESIFANQGHMPAW